MMDKKRKFNLIIALISGIVFFVLIGIFVFTKKDGSGSSGEDKNTFFPFFIWIPILVTVLFNKDNKNKSDLTKKQKLFLLSFVILLGIIILVTLFIR